MVRRFLSPVTSHVAVADQPSPRTSGRSSERRPLAVALLARLQELDPERDGARLDPRVGSPPQPPPVDEHRREEDVPADARAGKALGLGVEAGARGRRPRRLPARTSRPRSSQRAGFRTSRPAPVVPALLSFVRLSPTNTPAWYSTTREISPWTSPPQSRLGPIESTNAARSTKSVLAGEVRNSELIGTFMLPPRIWKAFDTRRSSQRVLELVALVERGVDVHVERQPPPLALRGRGASAATRSRGAACSPRSSPRTTSPGRSGSPPGRSP